MSYQYNNNCYSDQIAAVRAIASDQVGKIVVIGTASYSTNVESVTASSISYRLQDLNSQASITKTVSVDPQPCGLLDVSDGLIIGWGIAAAWLVTAGVLFLKRGVQE